MDSALTLTLPTFALILGAFGTGKTSLLKYLLYTHAPQIVGVVLISNTGADSYDLNYPWINKRLVYSHWNPEIIQKIKEFDMSIKYANPKHHLLLIFDDSSMYLFNCTHFFKTAGIASDLFTSKEFKSIATTLRWYNVSIIISIQQLQNEVTTLVRNQLRHIFLFQMSETHGRKALYENWGKPSVNLQDKKEFEQTLMGLPTYHFLKYDTRTHEWSVTRSYTGKTAKLPFVPSSRGHQYRANSDLWEFCKLRS